jgi:hypothetical protein
MFIQETERADMLSLVRLSVSFDLREVVGINLVPGTFSCPEPALGEDRLGAQEDAKLEDRNKNRLSERPSVSSSNIQMNERCSRKELITPVSSSESRRVRYMIDEAMYC